MNKITLEKTHALLEKLAEYVMTEVATKSELRLKADKTDLNEISDNIEKLDHKVNQVTTILDNQAKSIDILRTEQLAQSKTLDRIDERVTDLETRESGYRVRDKDE